MNFSWLWARFRSMTLQEVKWRVGQLLRERLEKFLSPPQADLSLGVPHSLRFPRADLNSGYIDKAACLEAAEKILGGRGRGKDDQRDEVPAGETAAHGHCPDGTLSCFRRQRHVHRTGFHNRRWLGLKS
mgnify:CR=1 FL=1